MFTEPMLKSYVRTTLVQAANMHNVQFSTCFTQKHGVKLYGLPYNLKPARFLAFLRKLFQPVGFRVYFGRIYSSGAISIWVTRNEARAPSVINEQFPKSIWL